MGDGVQDKSHVSEITGRAGQVVSEPVCWAEYGTWQGESPSCLQTLYVTPDDQYEHF